MIQFSLSAIPSSHFCKLTTDLTEALKMFQGGEERGAVAKSLQGACYFLQNIPYFEERGLTGAMLPILAGVELLDDGARPAIFLPCKSAKLPTPAPSSDGSLDPTERLTDALLISVEKSGRLGGIIAIRAFIDYIGLHPEMDNDLALPLSRLVDALERLDHGIVDVLLAPRVVKGAPVHDTYPDIVKATAVAVVDALMKAGDPSSVAVGRVTRELQVQGFPMGGHRNTPDAKILQRWREGMSRLKESSILLNVYETISTELENIIYPSPDAAWADLKPRLARMIQNNRLRLGLRN